MQRLARADRAQRTDRRAASSLARGAGVFSSSRPRRVGIKQKATDEDDLQENKLGPNVLAGIREVKANTKWTAATVIKNE
jgi:hypothetical protein